MHILASDQRKFLFFRALFEQLSLLKATFDCFLSSFWEITGNFVENLEQLVESPRYGSCDISLSSLGNCFYFYNFWISFYSRSLLKRKDISGQFRWVLSMNFIGKTNHTNEEGLLTLLQSVPLRMRKAKKQVEHSCFKKAKEKIIRKLRAIIIIIIIIII